MNDLQKSRETIDKIDKKMAKLFVERLNAVEKIALYKKMNELKVYDAKREQEIILKNCEYIKDKVLKEYYKSFIEKIMEISRSFQDELIK